MTHYNPTPQDVADEKRIEQQFRYHAPSPDQVERMEHIRMIARKLAYVLIREAPYGPDRTAALHKLRETVMTANAAILVPQ